MATFSGEEMQRVLGELRRLHSRHVALTLAQLELALGSPLSHDVRKIILDALNAHHRAILSVLSLDYEQ